MFLRLASDRASYATSIVRSRGEIDKKQNERKGEVFFFGTERKGKLIICNNDGKPGNAHYGKKGTNKLTNIMMKRNLLIPKGGRK